MLVIRTRKFLLHLFLLECVRVLVNDANKFEYEHFEAFPKVYSPNSVPSEICRSVPHNTQLPFTKIRSHVSPRIIPFLTYTLASTTFDIINVSSNVDKKTSYCIITHHNYRNDI